VGYAAAAETFCECRHHPKFPLPGFIPGAYVLATNMAEPKEGVDGRVKPGQDDIGRFRFDLCTVPLGRLHPQFERLLRRHPSTVSAMSDSAIASSANPEGSSIFVATIKSLKFILLVASNS
jgi:hypothetical protein